jgi:hypothetical protein
MQAATTHDRDVWTLMLNDNIKYTRTLSQLIFIQGGDNRDLPGAASNKICNA